MLLFSTIDLNETSIIINELQLKEQNFFWIGVEDYFGCELIGQQFLYELPHKSYSLDENGNILNTDYSLDDFSSAMECYDCHSEHYDEWLSSMHAYTMQSPLFFSYKEQSSANHPITGERFCMQCHNPISFLTGEDISMYTTPTDLQCDSPNVVTRYNLPKILIYINI